MDFEDAGYNVLGPIARGGMAEVLLAERIGPGGVRKRLAIKRLLPEVASDPEFVTMLENEARIAVELDHANVVSVFELGEANGELFLAMEYVRGWDLGTILDACARGRRQVPLDLVTHIIHQLCLALAYAHEKKNDHGAPLGIVHRDVSPSNVLVSADGAVKLADFGIARAAANAKSITGLARRAKIPYMSPEQAAGEPLDARSDLYSLGIVLYELVAGERLYGDDLASARAARTRPTPRLTQRRPDAATIQPIVDRMLQNDRDARYPSAREIAQDIARARPGGALANGAERLRAFLAELGLPAPVGPENIGDGERTMPFNVPSPRPKAESEPFDPFAGFVVEPSLEPATEQSPQSEPRPPPSPVPIAMRPSPELSRPARAPGRTTPSLRGTLVAIAAGAAVFAATIVVTRKVAEPAGSVEVRTTPPGATVWIDGSRRGTTPLLVEDLPRRLVVVRVGFREATAEEYRLDLAATRDQTVDIAVH